MNLQIAVHKVGNKANDEGCYFSNGLLHVDEEVVELLRGYFLQSFKFDTLYEFYHETDVRLNEVFVYVSNILEDPTTLHEQSKALAKHLYQCSDHPKIKVGELYVVYFEAFDFKGDTYPAVGLFKSEQKDMFLKVQSRDDNFLIDKHEGVNVNKLDKGAIIVQTSPDQLQIAVVDNANKQVEAQYWLDSFLKVQQVQNEYYHTQQTMSMYKSFVIQDLPEQFEVTKADQADLLNRSMQYFKENDSFELEHFEQEVLAQPEIIDRFVAYRQEYAQHYEVAFEERFDISEAALKKQSRNYKSVIKLDKNFHIYIHGDRSKIEQGIDEDGRKYYKIFYDVEQ
ncbi:MAG TPA: nucleoid-associated protein [Edaphocola sp.]|nr:nucleoid-associated protein [Edaphocola sp.]